MALALWEGYGLGTAHVGTAHATPPQPDPALVHLRATLARLAQDPRLAGAKVAYAVGDLLRPALLAHERASEKLSVASNAKIVTSSAVLSLLGPDFRFKTAVYGKRPVHGRVEGPIYLKGYGDPSLTDADLWRLATLVRGAGVKEVSGGLVYDESYFDRQGNPPLFATRSTDASYRPVTGALSLNENTVSVSVFGAEQPGAIPQIACRPQSSYLKLVNKLRTVNPRRRSWVRVRTRQRGMRTDVVVRGQVRVGYRGPSWRRRIAHAGPFAAAAFAEFLNRVGVRVHQKKISRGLVDPALKRPLAVHRSEALGGLVRRMNKVSSNFMAEQLLKSLGAETAKTPGTWAKGLRALEGFLATLGIARGSYALQNGSGLYEATSFSAQQLVTVLRAAYLDFRYSADFVASLAIAGTDGTLGHRFIGTGAERYIRAKTGTLSKVVALSGYAGASGTTRRMPLAFSILVTDLADGRLGAGRAVADQMAQAIVTYLER